ncbi:helix-turn-helix domain-containing protein [Paenibacillus hodogayensis]|uniref:Helix-turn-helix domain-containing protein n=1 Tax=Paenibacillus hodogayensis TaxID=279208 RepID=A0ABV5VZE5_9BACL
MERLYRCSGVMSDECPFSVKRQNQGAFHKHGHEFVELVYVVHGEGVHILEEAEYRISAGDVYVINPGETHAYAVPEGMQVEIVNCLFMPSLIPDALLKEFPLMSPMDYSYVRPLLDVEAGFNRHLSLNGQEAVHVLGLLNNMSREAGKRAPGHLTIIRLQMLQLLVLLSRSHTIADGSGTDCSPRSAVRDLTAGRIYGYLERNCDRKITQESLAALFHVGVRQLNRLMRQEFGKSMVDVLHDIRIERAKRRLAESDEKVASVAALVGYEDPTFFGRLFLRQTGYTPTQYRQSLERFPESR